MSSNLSKDISKRTSTVMLVAALAILIAANVAQPVEWAKMLGPILLFSVAFTLASDLGQSLTTDHINLAYLMAMTALLATGLTPALWAVTLGAVLAEVLKRLLAWRSAALRRSSWRTWHLSMAEAAVNAISLFVAGLIYKLILESLDTPGWTQHVLILVQLFGSYFLAHNALDAWLRHARGESFSDHLQRNQRQILAVQLLPLPFTFLLAGVYLQLGGLAFVVICTLSIGLWTLSRRLVETRRNLERRVRELHTLNRVGQALASSLELDVLLNTIYHQVRQSIQADHFYIALYDAVTDELSFPLVFEDGERKHYANRRAGNGLTEYVIRQRKPVLIPDHTAHVITNLGLEVIGQPALSWLGVPLSAGDTVRGVITVQSFSHSHAYDQEDMALLATLAAQAAIALENAQLYGQMRRRTAELALLNTVSTAVSSTLNLDQVLQIVVTSIMPIMVCQKSALFLLDGPDGDLQLAASQGLSDTFKTSPTWRDEVRLRRVRDQDLVVVSDVTASQRTAAEVEVALKEGYRAFAEVSLVTQSELIGVLAVYYDQVHYFDMAERDLLTTFANQAATAIANARLYSRTDQALARRVEELSAIEYIGRMLTSTLEPQRVFDLVLDQAMAATHATQGGIIMLDQAQRQTRVATHRGYATEAVEQFLNKTPPPNGGIVGRVLASGQLALVRDVGQDPAYISLDPSTRSQLTVPVLRESTVLGAINLESHHMDGFDEQDASFVSQLATQAVVALKNAQLFQERSQRVEELSLLYQASLALASSMEYRDVLDIISRLAQHITNSDTVTLYLYDPAYDKFERASTQGYRADETHSSSIRRKGITRTIIETGQPVLVADTHSHPNINTVVVKRGIRSVIGVPVMSRGEILGALFVNHQRPNVYTENDVQLVSALANQAGATIANVRLFTQVSEARDRLEAIINSTREGILVLNNTGRVVIANGHMELFSNLARDQLMGRTLDELRQEHQGALTNLLGIEPDALVEWMASLQTDPKASFTRTFQTRGPEESPRPHFTELFGTPVLDEVGQVIGHLMVFRDITEEKELEQMREDLTGMIVHDLRSPLTAILSGLELIKELALDQDSDSLAFQAMKVADRSCQNMLTLVNSLLDISRLERGQMPLERAPAPFVPLARSAIARLSTLAVARGVRVRTEFPSNLPMVEIDNEKIGRVLINLLDNALKFAPTGGQVILRAVHQNGESGDVLLCSVSDSGPGIPKEFQEKIFDRFAQVRDQAVTPRQRGTGLGLAFCKLAVEAHAGKIWVESEPDQGSTFYFTLPVADVEAWLNR